MLAGGEVERAPDPARVRAELERAKAGGCAAVAVVFMHGYRYPEHERLVAELARSVGFSAGLRARTRSRRSSSSSGAATPPSSTPISRRFSRATWRRSRRSSTSRARGARLTFMMSSGGLTAAELVPRQGRDPVGPRRRRRRHGRDRALGGVRSASSASTWAAPRPTSPISTAPMSAPSRPRSPACACGRR